jgi:D-sedoheptulose 7-phosphate isomerase
MVREERLTATILPTPLVPTIDDAVRDALRARQRALRAALSEMDGRAPAIARAATLLVGAVRSGHKILAAGNGGSAAEAQHFTAELVGRFKRERRAYPMLSLTVDTSILTAIANDYCYQDVFARQIEALGQPNDVFVALSTSGRSFNLLRAANAAHLRSMSVIAITGNHASPLARLADIAIRVASDDTAIAQELHTMVVHILCDLVEQEMLRVEEEGQG